ncbi:MAG: pseudouridine synthase [Gammaproteobacteria bacterium]|jgi:23S rRNA pseudouridine2457 synthase
MAKLILFNKPFGVLSQFSGDEPASTLSQFISVPGVYPAGRLDKDSEGLLLLTNSGALQHRISHPRRKMAKTYWVQVEGEIDAVALARLREGLMLKDGQTQPADARLLREPDLWPRNPPVRFRKQIPTSWMEITLREGKNRQVRRMTAAVGLPTLRLVRIRIGPWELGSLHPGQWRALELPEEEEQLRPNKKPQKTSTQGRGRADRSASA